MPFMAARRAGGGTGTHLDTQYVTTGAFGSAPSQDRVRGFASGLTGSITDGTSDIYSGSPITNLYWDENLGLPFYQLTITGAADSGWATITIAGKTLFRTSATYSAGTWTWNTTDTASTQAFGGAGAVKTVYFD